MSIERPVADRESGEHQASGHRAEVLRVGAGASILPAGARHGATPTYSGGGGVCLAAECLGGTGAMRSFRQQGAQSPWLMERHSPLHGHTAEPRVE